jgi:ribosome biogenesis GTPase A
MLAGHWASTNPPILLLDSPGVMLPRIDDKEVGLRLGLIGV